MQFRIERLRYPGLGTRIIGSPMRITCSGIWASDLTLGKDVIFKYLTASGRRGGKRGKQARFFTPPLQKFLTASKQDFHVRS